MKQISRLAALIAMAICAVGVFAASASAISPTVTTGAATGLKDTQVTLSGTVNPNGKAAGYWLEYGPTASYGFRVPFNVGNAGAGTTPVEVKNPVTGLTPATTYHYRVSASNIDGVATSPDKTFTTPAVDVAAALGGMATTEPFDGSAGSLSNFSANWAALGWASSKGEDSASGWLASGEYPSVSGAYLNQTLTDAGQGLGVSATMAAGPGSEGRNFSLWLDMSNPSAATRAGYQLKATYQPAGTYSVVIVKWSGAGGSAILATQPVVSLSAGNAIGITDVGSSVKVWTNTGSGFKQLLSATDTAFSGGKVGLEASGNVTRLTKFKTGALLTPVANNNEALAALTQRDSFLTPAEPLAGNWSALAWDNSPDGHNTGQIYTNGWGPTNPAPTVNGAYWQKAAFADTGAGSAASVIPVVPPGPSKSFSLWLDMPSPGSAKTGYEARFLDNGSGQLYEVSINKWQAGVKTVIGGTFMLSPPNYRIAFVDKGTTLSLYNATESTYSLAASLTDSTFNSGFAGIEASGNVLRMRDFRAGPLAPF
jgi:hypothetical protein